MANRAAGKGYENENFYTNIKFQFWGIENIHVMRGSLQKMIEGKKHCYVVKQIEALQGRAFKPEIECSSQFKPILSFNPSLQVCSEVNLKHFYPS